MILDLSRAPACCLVLLLAAGCRRDASPPPRGAAVSHRAPDAVVVAPQLAAPALVPIPAPPTPPTQTELPPPPPPPPPPSTPLDAVTSRFVTQARAASRRRDFSAACELIERAERHAPGHPEVRGAARSVAHDIEQAYAFTRTGPGFYHTVQICIRQGVPVDMEIFS